MRDILLKEGFEYRTSEKKHSLSQDEMEDRADYCKGMLKYKARKIKTCFFSDEMGIRLTDLYKARKLWLLPEEELCIEKLDQDVKVNCWGAISWNGATSLYIFTQNLKKPLYETIVGSHKQEMVNLFPGRDFCYQQDNHPTHQNFKVFDDDENIEVIDFPTYSPDLNPIENIWATLKYIVPQDVPRTEEELKQSLRYNWQQITKVEILRPYIATLEDRYRECIEKDGQRLPY